MSLGIYIFGSDERQKNISRYLIGNKLVISKNEIKWQKENLIILPTPLYKYKSNEFVVKNNSTVVSGAISEEWKDYFYQKNIEYFDFMQDEKTVLQNAEITAEATLLTYLQNSKYRISDEKIIVSGYGRCGKMIAQKFGALGAKVTILARAKAARKDAIKNGYNAVDFSYGPQEAYGTRAIINTVPEIVIKKETLSELQKGCLLIEIASNPGGFERDYIKENELRYISAPGLPSKYLQKTSAKVLADYVNRIVKNKWNYKVDDVWIYQVSP